MRCHRLIVTVLILGWVGPSLAIAQASAGQKIALLVGVNAYDHSNLEDLKFAERDVEKLADLLRVYGYDRTTVLTNTAGQRDARLSPTLENIRRELTAVLEKRTKRDTVLVVLSGHGLQPDGTKDSYFCPANGEPGKVETLLSLTQMYRHLDDSGAGVKLLLVDACRNDPAAKGA